MTMQLNIDFVRSQFPALSGDWTFLDNAVCISNDDGFILAHQAPDECLGEFRGFMRTALLCEPCCPADLSSCSLVVRVESA